MAKLYFPINLTRQVEYPDAEIDASTVGELFEQYFLQHPKVESYVLDDQGAIRKHIVVLVEGANIKDRQSLMDKVSNQSEVHIFNALSGG